MYGINRYVQLLVTHNVTALQLSYLKRLVISSVCLFIIKFGSQIGRLDKCDLARVFHIINNDVTMNDKRKDAWYPLGFLFLYLPLPHRVSRSARPSTRKRHWAVSGVQMANWGLGAAVCSGTHGK